VNDSNIPKLHAPGLDSSIAITDQHFIYQGNRYHLVSAGVLDDYAFAETDPRNAVLEQKIASAIAADRLRNPDFNQLQEQLTEES